MTENMTKVISANQRLCSVELDEEAFGEGNNDQRQERASAISDLIDENLFALPGDHDGPYRLLIGLQDGKLVLDIRHENNTPLIVHVLSLTTLRRYVRDYFAICESYYQAVRSASPAQIETIDMARRGLHNEGSEFLRERLAGKIETDHATARRLFTLITALYWKG